MDLHGTTDIDDIESVGLYHTDSKGMIDTNKPVLQTVSASEKVVFNTDISIDTDTFPFWVSFKLKDKVDLSHRFKASCTKIETNEGEIKVPVVMEWRTLATKLEIAKSEQERFAAVFEKQIL